MRHYPSATKTTLGSRIPEKAKGRDTENRMGGPRRVLGTSILSSVYTTALFSGEVGEQCRRKVTSEKGEKKAITLSVGF